ncbi:DUF2167 domain-containing protein [Chitinophaga sp. 22321]|uniref:DUF2167 domain-containing protein n=1 Tax=Chitinophaga hostae TaxID=2831022 RepID=A0ABS5IYZ0_9BACT|nr:DUF2167 domain-containing protein [Chitinophaga hostae]MBS0027402.1 DUF2167 domain-containing protein [Chitinophaga hostae]
MRTFYCSFVMFFCLSVSLSVLGLSREDSLSKYDKLDSSDIIVASFSYSVGEQELGQGAVLQVPEGYRLLNAARSRLLVEHLWGNPENPNTLGVLVPERTGPLDKDFRGFVISFEPSGYLDEQEAGKINYGRLLREMKEELKNDNLLRGRKGAGVITSMDWAFPPYFDKKSRTLHWARILHFDGGVPPVLNYEVRLLGRKGALCFTAIGKVGAIAQVKQQLQQVAASAHFTNGNGYTDFNPRTDQPARWAPEEISISTRILSPENLMLGVRSTLLMLLVSLCMVLFVYVMHFYHHRRKHTYRKMIDFDERLN